MIRFRRSASVGVIDDGERVFAAVLPQGPIIVLAGVAAAAWRAAPGADLEGLAAGLHAAGVCEDGMAEADAALYARAFVDAGLLQEEEE